MTTIGVCLMFAERRITSEALYRTFSANRLKKAGKAERAQSEPLLAGLDCGVWLAWCDCGAGIGVHPGWYFAACSCGKTWSRVVFPEAETLDRIDAILSLRPAGSINKAPLRFYSWRPEETVRDLVIENIRHGWAIPEGAESWP